MPPVLSMGGGRSAWLSVHCEPVSEWELSARTSCQEKKKRITHICTSFSAPTGVGHCFAVHSVII